MSVYFPGNNSAAEGFRRTAAKGMPSPPHPLTFFWSVWVEAFANTFATIWWMAPDNGSFSGVDYYGPALGPWTGGNTRFGISANGTDVGDTVDMELGRWYRQAFRAHKTASGTFYEYWPDLDNSQRSISKSDPAGYYPANLSDSSLRFGNASWSVSEGLNGRIGALKIFQVAMPDAAILVEAQHARPFLPEYKSRVWGEYPLRSHNARDDISGHGRDFFTLTGDPLFTRGGPPVNWARQIATGTSAAVVAGDDITASGTLSITGAADLDAIGSLIAAGSLGITGSADLDASGTLAAAGSLSITGAADLDAVGDLLAVGALSISGAADLDAIGQLVAAGTLSINGAADLDATGALAAAGSVAINGAASLTGSLNDITAAGSLSITGAASLTALGELTATGSVAITGIADLTGDEAPPDVGQTPAGRPKPPGPRRRYYVEIDGQQFEVSGPEEAQELFDRARALAERAAEKAADKAVSSRKQRQRVAPVALIAPRVTASAELEIDLSSIRADLKRIYRDAAIAAEMRLLLARAAEQDEEEALLLLM